MKVYLNMTFLLVLVLSTLLVASSSLLVKSNNIRPWIAFAADNEGGDDSGGSGDLSSDLGSDSGYKSTDSDLGSKDGSPGSSDDATTTTTDTVDSGSVSDDTQTPQDIGNKEDTGKEDSTTTLGAPNGGTGIDNGGDSNSNDDTSAVEPAKPLKDKDGGDDDKGGNDHCGDNQWKDKNGCHDDKDDNHNHNKGGHHDDHNGNQHHNNWCDHHDCHHHNHHTSTHFSGHEGDVTVKINTKYEEKNPKNLDDVDLIIGDVYEKTLDLSDKPSQITVEHLDIDGGDDFAVCLANEDSQDGECTVATADSDHSTETVYLTVK